MTKYNKDNPFPSKILERYVLNKEGSTKKTYHVTLDLSASNITYKEGDSIGIFPENPSDQVVALLEALNKTGHEEISDPRSSAQMTLEHFLKTKTNLLRLTTPLLKLLGDPKLLTEDNKDMRTQFIANHDLIDLFNMHPPTAPLQEIISYFTPLLPRFYSIASANAVSSNSVDLLIATFTYWHANKEREGVASKFLTKTAKLHTTPIPIFLHPTSSFTLPDPDTPILMIGPGTGVAPYRGFLQQRVKEKASGLNWLIFGERNKNTDFYYESFFTSLQKKGSLRLDLAFSRDQKEKIYVQHKLLENACDVWNLMQSGGTIYICGDARRMAKDVTSTLHNIAETQGHLSPSEAKDLFKQMRREKRLLMDVY
jgi:sulfite reductase (NADPH) flavoprotein alpha-component